MPNHSGPMACPIDGATLVMSERAGIEIDYCPSCRGVWLDRGELDKIVERSKVEMAAPAPSQQPQQPQSPQQGGSGPWGAPPQPPGYPPQQPYGYGHGYHGKPYKRKKSFLEDLFD